MHKIYVKNVSKQRGTVLVLALLLLFVMTLIGVSAMTTSTMEERMSGNMRDRILSSSAAEAALRDAENLISTRAAAGTLTVSNFNTSSGGFYALGQGPSAGDAFTGGWWGSGGSIPYSRGSITDVKTLPEYTIEYRGQIVVADKSSIEIKPPPHNKAPIIESFRITARSTGLTPNSVVILQSHWGQRFN